MADPRAELRRCARQLRTASDARRLAGMAAVILALHVIGFGLLFVLVAPAHLSLGSQSFGVGVGLTAYTLGMRHAFDIDHIAAIDNTTRKLMADGSRPVSVGFWFSLGHSSVVFAMCVLLALGIRSVVGQVQDGNSTLHQVAGTLGLSMSGAFLLLLGAINLAILIGVLRLFRRMRTGEHDEAALEALLTNRGVLARVLFRATRAVHKPCHMYPVGLLFGFGFDTATEVSLLVLASTGAALALPWYAVLCLPILFTAGMCLFDTVDGSFMNFAYGWAFSQPVRKVYYNLTVTALSVLVAIVIGGSELLGLLATKLRLTGTFWEAIAAVGAVDYTGYLVVALFVGTWLVSWLVWRYGRIEERWTLHAPAAPALDAEVVPSA